MISPNIRFLVPGALLLVAIVLSPTPLPEAARNAVLWLGIICIGLSLIAPQTAAQRPTRRRKRRRSNRSNHNGKL